jgi:hypothetical protein
MLRLTLYFGCDTYLTNTVLLRFVVAVVALVEIVNIPNMKYKICDIQRYF